MSIASSRVLLPVAGLSLLAGVLGAQSASRPSPNYEISDSLAVGHVSAQFFTLDVVNRRLYGAGNVIVDIDALRVVGRIADSTPGAGYIVAAETNRGITSQGVVFNLADGAVGQRIHAKATGFAYDAVSKRAFLLGDTVTVLSLSTGGLGDNMTQQQQRGMGGGGGGGGGGGYGGGGMSAQVIPGGGDTARLHRPPAVRLTATVVGTFSLPGSGGIGVTDAKGRAFLSLVSRDSLAIVDTDKLKVEGIVGLSSCKHPLGLAIDNVHHRVFAACDGQVAVLAVDRGHVTDIVDVPGHADQIAYSPGNGFLFVPSGDHGITVLHEDSPDTYSVVQTIADPRLEGAKVVVFDPTTHRIIVPHQGPDGLTYYMLSRPL